VAKTSLLTVYIMSIDWKRTWRNPSFRGAVWIFPDDHGHVLPSSRNDSEAYTHSFKNMLRIRQPIGLISSPAATTWAESATG
jgi:hypothetical protein